MFIFLILIFLSALPLGVVIVPSESTSCLTAAFRLLLSLFENEAFYGNGLLGPACFRTDDSEAEIKAWHAVWSEYANKFCNYFIHPL